MAVVVVTVSEQEKTDIEVLALSLGFSSVSLYLNAVLKAHLLRQHGEKNLSAYTAEVLLVMPENERREIRQRMAALAEAEYTNNPDLVAFNAEDDFYDYPDAE